MKRKQPWEGTPPPGRGGEAFGWSDLGEPVYLQYVPPAKTLVTRNGCFALAQPDTPPVEPPAPKPDDVPPAAN